MVKFKNNLRLVEDKDFIERTVTLIFYMPTHQYIKLKFLAAHLEVI
jgi:hypothetical protein